MKKTLNYRQTEMLSNILTFAAQHYRENAVTFNRLIDHKPKPDDMMQICGDAARALEKTFIDQANSARALAQLFGAAEGGVEIEFDEEQVEMEDMEEALG